jgi:hypothetical protein
MKTITIKTLKKELLVIELPTAETKISIGLHCIGIKPLPIGKYASDINGYYHIYTEMFHGFKLLGSPDEIKEDDAINLVGEGFNISANKKVFNDYNDDCNCFKTAIESFRSALESEIYWENPYGKEPIENLQSSTFGGEKTIIHRNPMNILWNEAESRTFDRNRTLIFVKN